MVVSPNPTAVTTPFSTVAMLSFSLLQTIVLVVSAGSTVAVSVAVSPRAMVSVSLSSVMPVQGLTMVRVAEASSYVIGFISIVPSYISSALSFITVFPTAPSFTVKFTVNISPSICMGFSVVLSDAVIATLPSIDVSISVPSKTLLAFIELASNSSFVLSYSITVVIVLISLDEVSLAITLTVSPTAYVSVPSLVSILNCASFSPSATVNDGIIVVTIIIMAHSRAIFFLIATSSLICTYYFMLKSASRLFALYCNINIASRNVILPSLSVSAHNALTPDNVLLFALA